MLYFKVVNACSPLLRKWQLHGILEKVVKPSGTKSIKNYNFENLTSLCFKLVQIRLGSQIFIKLGPLEVRLLWTNTPILEKQTLEKIYYIDTMITPAKQFCMIEFESTSIKFLKINRGFFKTIPSYIKQQGYRTCNSWWIYFWYYIWHL